MHGSRFAVCLALALAPVSSLAQEPASDSVPFHRHQWAAQFTGGTSFASLGFLRFTAPARAWLIDLQITGGHGHESSYHNDSLTEQSYSSRAVIDARIGRRFYQERGKSVVSFQTVGGLGGFNHACGASTLGFGSSCTNGWTAGAFGEVGAAYLITRRFSIGGAVGASFSYSRATLKSPGGFVDKEWSYQGSFDGLSFAATVYF